jgi:TP901 family phage tail tape measure protein
MGMGDNSLNIIISAILKKTTEAELIAQLKQIEKNAPKMELKMDMAGVSKDVDKFTQKIETLVGQSSKLTQETREYTVELGKTKKVIDDIDKETGQVVKTTTLLVNNQKEITKEKEKQIKLEQELYFKSQNSLAKQKQSEINSAHIEALKVNTKVDKMTSVEKDAYFKSYNALSNQKQDEVNKAHLEALRIDKEITKEKEKQFKYIQSEKEAYFKSQNSLSNQKQSEIDTAHLEAIRENAKYDQQSSQFLKNKIDVSNSLYKQKQAEISASHTEALGINKSLELQKQETLEIQKQIAQYKEKLAIRLKDAQVSYGKSFSETDKKAILDKSDLINVNNYKDGIKATNLEFDKHISKSKELRKEATLAMKESDGVLKTFGKDVFKLGIWSLSATLLYAPLRAMQDGIKYITELDNSLNEIRIVTGQSQVEVEKLAKSYNNLGKEMSVTTKEIAGTAADLFRQGLDNSQVEDRMKGIIQYAKISSISLQDSNRIITATANATGESITKIIDMFSLLGDSTSSGADEIGESLQRVASAAENSGLSIEKSSSWLSTILSITKEGASTVGRSLNSLISRYESIKSTGFNSEDSTKINDVVKALSDVGIVATDTAGQLKPISDVMDELGGKWEGLSKNEKAYIATTLGGTFQRNRLLTLLNNYNDSLKNYELALDSAGTSEKKFAIYQESSAAKMDKAKVAIEGFWQNAINSDVIKTAIDGFGSLISVLDVLVNNSFVLAIIQIAVLSASVYGLGFGIGKLATVIVSSNFGLKFVAMLEMMTASTVGFSVGLKALTTTMLASPLFWVVAGATAIFGIVKGVQYLTSEVERQKEKITELTSEYDKLTESLDKNEKKAKDVITRLSELYNLRDSGKISSKEDEELKKLEAVNLELQNQIKYEKTLREIKGRDIEDKTLALSNKKTENSSKSPMIVSPFFGYAPITIPEKINEDIELLSEYKQKLDDLEKGYSNNEISAKKYSKEKSKLNKDISKYSTSLESLVKKLEEENKSYITDASKGKKESNEKIIKSVKEMIISLSANSNEWDKNTKAIESNTEKIKSTTLSTDDYAKSLEKVNKATDDFQSSAKNISSLFDTISEGEKLSSDSLLDLIQNYPQLSSQIMDANSSKEAGIKLTEALWEIEKIRAVDKLQQEQKILEAETKTLEATAANLAAMTFWGGSLPLEDQMSIFGGKDLEKKNEQLDAIRKSIDYIKGLSIPDYSSSSKKSSSSADKNPEKYKLESDAYMGLTQILNDVNNALEENNTLQELAGKSNIDLLDEEISLLEQKRKAINDITWQQKQEANDLRYTLETGYGIGFDGKGNISQSSYDSTMQSKADYVNSLPSGDNRDASIQELDNIKKWADRYADLISKEITSNNNLMSKIGGDIAKVQADKITLSFDDLKSQFELGKITLSEYISKLKNLQSTLALNDKQASELTKTIKDLSKTEQDAIQKSADEKLKTYEDVNKKVQDLLKKQYEQQDKIATRIHEDEIKRLDKEKDTFKEYIDSKQSELDKFYDNQDYEESVSDSSKKILEYQSEINKRVAASNSGDLEAMAEIKEYQEKLTDEKKQLNKTQRDQEKSLRKQNLDDTYKTFEKAIDKQKETEDESFESHKRSLEDKTEETAIALEAQRLLISNNLETTKNAITSLFTTTGESATTAGALIQQEIIDKLAQVRDINANLASITAKSSQGVTDKKAQTIQQMKANSAEWETASISRRQELADDNLKMGTSLGWTRNNGDWFDESGIKAYSSGGVDSTGGMSLLHGKPNAVETIFNANQGKKLFDFVNNLPNFMPKFNIAQPQISMAGVGGGSSGDIRMGDINIAVTGNVDNNMINKLANEVARVNRIEINKLGQFRR